MNLEEKKFNDFLDNRCKLIESKMRIDSFEIPDHLSPGEIPYIITSPGFKRTTDKGKTVTIKTVSMTTKTTKMAAGSFGLPAGPVNQYGSCPGASLGRGENKFICHGCYAMDGMYRMYSTIAYAQYARMSFVKEMIASGKNKFADYMIGALTHWWSRPRFLKIKSKTTGKHVQIEQSDKYFRIHDSGDFFSKEYFNEWVSICEHFNGKKFWAPIRIWMFPSLVNHMIKKAPSNLILRPSAMHFDDMPPKVSGLSAGSSASDKRQSGVWTCPAYKVEDATHTCANAKGPNGKIPCRACWDNKKCSVRYMVHGSKAKNIVSGRAAVRANPMPSLETVYVNFADGKRLGRIAPGTEFEGWIMTQGYQTSDFSEKEWFSVLERLGYTADETVAYLEGAAEWQI